MAKTKQLDVVHGLSRSKVDELANEVSGLMKEKAQADDMLAQLVDYVDDYSVSLFGSDTPRRRSGSLVNERLFVAKLSGAVVEQRLHSEQVAQRVSYRMNAWMRAKADLEALERLIERRSQQSKLSQQRDEQRASDAHALRSAYAKCFHTATSANEDGSDC